MTTFRLCGGAALLVAAWAIATPPTLAQIETDGSVGPRRALKGPDFRIDEQLGKRVGDNLFHSFEKFNIRTLGDGTIERATFRGANDIAHVISRVTGASPSEINGLLRSEVGKADLWFINPNGVTFGPNARLDVPGSFHVSTPDQLRLADGAAFSAADPDASTLTVAPPEAFGFLGDSAADILVSGSRLEIPDGETLSLSSGRIDIDNAPEVLAAEVRAAEGRVLLTTQADPGEVRASSGRPSTPPSGTIEIANAVVDTSGNGGGDIRVNTGELLLANAQLAANNTGEQDSEFGVSIKSNSARLIDHSAVGSEALSSGDAGMIVIVADRLLMSTGAFVTTSTSGAGDAGRIKINVGTARIAATVIDGSEDLVGVFSNAGERSRGDAGDIHVAAGRLEIIDGGVIGSSSRGSGDGGVIAVDVEKQLLMTGRSVPRENRRGLFSDEDETNRPGLRSSIISQIEPDSTAKSGGNLRIRADVLEVADEAVIRSVTFADGKAGPVSIDANRTVLRSGGQISSSTFARGDSGEVTVKVRDALAIRGRSATINSNDGEPEPSGIFGASESRASQSGNAGDLKIKAPVVDLRAGGEISTETFGRGSGATIWIAAPERLTIESDAQITSATEGSGRAGDIRIRAPLVKLNDLGNISAETFGAGSGGTIEVAAPGRLTIDRSALITSATLGSGRAGDIALRAREVGIGSEGSIDASSVASGKPGKISIRARRMIVTGNPDPDSLLTGVRSEIQSSSSALSAGRIEIDADEVQLLDGGEIRASSFGSGEAGRIRVNAEERLLITGRSVSRENRRGVESDGEDAGLRSSISSRIEKESEATAGGDIRVRAKALEISDEAVISSATLEEGSAGFVKVIADRIVLHDGGQISSSTFAEGDGGDVTVKAHQAMAITGQSATMSTRDGKPEPSGIFGAAENEGLDAGDGGDVKVSAPTITLRDRGEISSETFAAGTGGHVVIQVSDGLALSNAEITAVSTAESGGGDAGQIQIRSTGSLELNNGAAIRTEAESADGGQITISVGKLIDLAESGITTEVGGHGGDGGNITIDPRFLVLDRSVINASAAELSAGDITIVADNLVRSSSGSDIQATGGPAGVDGRIVIETVEADLVGDLAELPATFLVSERLFDQGCAARSGQPVSSLQGSGRGGLAQMPDAPLGAVLLADKLPSATGVTTKQAAEAGAPEDSFEADPSLSLLDCGW